MLRKPFSSKSGAFTYSFSAAILFTFCFVSQFAYAQDAETENKAGRLQAVAGNAQNDKNYEVAKSKWQQLLDEYPNSKAARKAPFNLGLCHYILKDYASAILAYEKALPILQSDESPNLPELLLALGFSRIQEGRRMAESDADESNIQLTSATGNLSSILKNHKDFADSNVAAYFCGQAYEDLQRFDEARTFYKQSVDLKKDGIGIDAMFALGRLSARDLDYEDAALWYEAIRTNVDMEQGHPRLNDTNLNYGDALLSMGVSELKDDDAKAANKRFLRAKEILTAPATDTSFIHRDEAVFLSASCSMYLGENSDAAETFEAVSKIENSELKDKAMVLAGSTYLKAGNEDRGIALLNQAIESESSFAVDAVHEMALYLLDQKRFQDTWDLTNQWAAKVADHPLAVEILLDRANASRGIQDKADRSAELYADIAAAYPTHRLAPGALYEAAFSNYVAKKYDAAIKQAKRFEEKYPGDKDLSYIREVQADSLLMQGQHAEAEVLFRSLVNDFQQDQEKRSWWVTRAGFASYLQKNYDDAIDWLENQDALITVSEHKAEALNWIGSSYLQKENYDKATQKLQESLDLNQTWRGVPEVMLMLCNAQLGQSQFDGAETTANSMLQSFANIDDNYVVEKTTEAFYSVADELMKVKEFDRAIKNFDVIADQFGKSKLAPSAVYRAAYAASEANRADAAERFGNFVDRFPEHEDAKQAALGRSAALRMSGNTDESIVELQKLVTEADDDATRQVAKYQLGLAYVDAKDWDNSIKTFTEMTENLNADSPNPDKIWYELAWAQRANKDEAGSLQSFASLVKNHPNSSTAPEAHFLLGNKAYTDKQYDDAIEQFEKANVDSARDEIREKALYKLGWCYFRKGNFDKAAQQFKTQADNHSDGKLYADGRYMVAQCAYRANNFKEAFQAYTVAKPAVAESATVSQRIKQLTLLNGAKSGNKTKNHAEAADMAKALLELPGIDDALKQQANLELGFAENALGNLEDAATVLALAAEDSGETGARAQALLGDILFKEAVEAAKTGNKNASKEKFGKAVEAYVDVYYGYGGSLASPEVKSWQAYAAYEAARCQMVQINDAEDVDKIILLGGAIKQFNYLVTRFPNSDLTPEAKKQLEKLNALKEKIGK